ncbi:hypothetical protein NP284_23040 [Rhodopseudomonas pseudopalustris]|uniref:hypothetical protein n=1 Tax=Rhodopseudomonas pseudopalustris TaxID=1513892 RepID=UPI0011AED4FB
MTKCTRCCQTTASLNVENVDGVYEIYSWTCSSCGERVDMAVANIDPLFELPDYCLMLDVETAATPEPHVVAALPKASRAAPRREAAPA